MTAERRRCGRDAGSSVANSYREETAARESHREEAAGQGAVAERVAGAPLLHHREAATGREVARHHREEIGKNLKSTRKPHTELLVDEGEEDSILFCNFGGKM